MNGIVLFIEKKCSSIHYIEMRQNELKKQIDRLIPLGVFSTKEATEMLSISQPTFSRWATQSDLIQKVSRGYYVHTEADINYEYLDYIVACKKFGEDAIIGGLSALEFYNLTKQVSPQVWVLVPPSRRISTNSKYKVIKTKSSLKIGVASINGFRIVSLDRTLIEALKYQSKIGEGIVFKAITDAIKNGHTSEDRLYKIAKKLNMISFLEKKWELLTI